MSRGSALFALFLAGGLVACTAARSVEGPTRHHRTIPPVAYAAYARGRIASYEDRHADAVAAFEAALAAAPDEPELHAALVEGLARAAQHARARAHADAVLAIWPDHAGLWLASGRAAYRRRDWPRAAAAFERAIALAPRDQDAYLRLAQVHRRLGDWPGEHRAYRRLIARAPGSVRGHYRLGARLVDRGAHADAIEPLSRALELEPDHVSARVALARALWATGRDAEGDTALRDAFDRAGGRLGTARRMFRKVLRAEGPARASAAVRLLDRDDLDAKVRVGLAAMLIEARAYPAAAAIARAVLASAPDHTAAQALLATALMRWLERVE